MQENYEEKIKLIHNILIAVSTGTNITPILNQNYSQLRNELLSSKYKDLLPLYVKSSLDLKQFWSVIKNKSPTPKKRWVSRATQVLDIKLYHARYIEGLWISC